MIQGNPVFRFTLTHSVAGSLVINEPIGWPDIKLLLTRDEQFHSLVEFFDGAFQFYRDNGQVNGGFNFIKAIENQYGVDADLTVLVEVSFDNASTFETVFTGLYDFSENEETNLKKIKSAIIRNDFWTKFITRQDTPVNIQASTSIDGNSVTVISPKTLNLLHQTLDKTSSFEGSTFRDGYVETRFDMPAGDPINEVTGPSNFDVFSTNFQAQTNLEGDEIEDTFDTILDFVSDFNDIAPFIELPTDVGGTINVSFRDARAIFSVDGNMFMSSAETDQSYIISIEVSGEAFYQINSGTEIGFGTLVSQTQPGPPNPVGVGFPSIFSIPFDLSFPDESFSVVLAPGDTFKMFMAWTVKFAIHIGTDLPGSIIWSHRELQLTNFTSDIDVTIGTTFPDSTAQSFYVHDVARSIVDRITGQNSSLTSSYLGRTDTNPSYPSNGCGSRYMNVKGLQIRNYSLTEKPFFLSFSEFWNGLNPILNLGLGYTNAQNKIEIGKQEDFYNPTISVYFDNVLNIVRRYDNDKLFNKIDIGYSKWQSENISGIDDPQTKHSYASRFKKVGKAISLISGFIAASYAIETTRRAVRSKSADYKYDDETFIISVRGLAAIFPETNENFDAISNLKHSEDRYNSRITPARNFLRWVKYFNGGLQKYIGSVYKFVAGEGNYDMTSLLNSSDCEYDPLAGVGPTVSEKEDVFVNSSYLHLPDLFEIDLPMTWNQWVGIRNNRKNAIGISQTTSGHTAFLIKELEYQPCFSKAKILAWPKTPFTIQTVDFVPPAENCE